MQYFLFMEETGRTGGDWTLLIILGVFIIGMLAFSIIPQRRKQKQMAEMNSRIKVGDKVKTIGGLYGTIVDFNEENNAFTILSGNSTFEIDRGCVYSMEILPSNAAAAAPAEVKEEKPTDEQIAACESVAQKTTKEKAAKENEEKKENTAENAEVKEDGKE